jgi:hypothetical protein
VLVYGQHIKGSTPYGATYWAANGGIALASLALGLRRNAWDSTSTPATPIIA